MSLNLYSAGKVDDLLSAKLSDAPSDGSTYGRKDGAWEVVSGGGASWGSITGTLSSQTDLATALGDKADVSGSTAISVSGAGGTSTLGADSGGTVSADDGSGSVTKLTTTGITFPDSTTQTTAAVAGANFGDAFTLGKVQEVTASSGYWQITFAPVNAKAMDLGLYVCLSDGSNAEAITSYSTSSTWTYTTSTNTSSDYIYIKYNGQVSSIAISNP